MNNLSSVNTSSRRYRSKGFTLLEMLLAIGISMVIATLCYQTLDAASRTNESVREVSKQMNDIDRIWQLIAMDLEFTINRSWVDVYGQSQPAFQAVFGDRLAQSDVTNSAENNYLLRFTRSSFSNLLQQNRSELGLVGYRIESQELGDEFAEENQASADSDVPIKVLWRDSWKVLDSTEALEPQSQRLLSGIESLRLRYLLPTAINFEENQWITGWPAKEGETASLPLAVEIELTLTGLGTVTRIFALPGKG